MKRHATTRRARCRGGFSLLEMMVALAVMSLAVVGMAGLTQLLQRVEGRTADAAEAMEQLSAAKRLFRGVVASSVPSSPADAAADRFGDASRFTALSRGPESLAAGVPQPIELSVEPMEDGVRLRMAWTDGRTGREHTEQILRKVRSASFRYFGAGGSDGERGWSDHWDDPSVLPQAIMLTIRLKQAAAPFEIIVRTRPPIAPIDDRGPVALRAAGP